MKYARILSAVAGQPWAIHEDKGRAILSFLLFASSGGRHDAETVAEIAAERQPDANAITFFSLDSGRMSAAEPSGGEGQSIAVVGLKGVISPRMSDEMAASGAGGTSAEGFTRRLNAAVSDPRVGAVVIDADTPGGNVYGVAEAAEALFNARGDKPIVAVASPMAASAGYWIASQADELVVTPSGEVGSIGVKTWHEDISAYLEKEGVKITAMQAAISPYKNELHPAFPLDDEARTAAQAALDRYGEQFVADVARGRGVTAAHVREKFGRGRMVGALDALAAGMVDRVATLDAEIERLAARLARPAEATSRRQSKEHRRRRLAVAV